MEHSWDDIRTTLDDKPFSTIVGEAESMILVLAEPCEPAAPFEVGLPVVSALDVTLT